MNGPSKNESIVSLPSDSDEQILIYIPFVQPVSLSSLHIQSSSEEIAPKTISIFSNSDNMDFTEAEEAKPVHRISLELPNQPIVLPFLRYLVVYERYILTNTL